MTDFAEDSGVDIEREVVVETETAPRERRSPFGVLPWLLGVIFLLVNLVIMFRLPSVFFAGGLAKNVSSTISLLLLLASIVTCLVLIVYGVAARRDDVPGEARGRYLRTVGVPLLLGLLAPLFTIWSLQVNKSANERSVQLAKPCIEVYEKAAAIAKDNPRFRMLATDRDEVRCAVNAAIGR